MEEMIEVTLPDGNIAKFPIGTPEEEVLAAVEQMVAGQPAARPPEPIGMGGEAVLSATQAGFDALQGDSDRARYAREIFDATLRGDQTLDEGIVQGVGEGINYLGEGLFDIVKSGAQAITPDALEDEIITQLGIFMDQPMMRMAMRALEAGGEAWARFSEENPRAARNIKAITQIGEIAPVRMGQQAISKSIRDYQPKAAQQAQVDIESGGFPATKDTTAKYRLEDEPTGPMTAAGREGPLPEPVPMRRAVKNPAQQQAIKQGFDEGLIAMIREASPTDRRNMLRSLEIMEQATGNKKFSMMNRTTDVAGESILNRYKVIRDVNKEAGDGIDDFAKKNLKNRAVDFEAPVQNFENALDNLGVKFNDDLTLNFDLSIIENVAPAEEILNAIVKRMRAPREVTAYDVHNLKRYIDENVNYGKAANGLTGRAVNVVKQLRRQLDEVLDNQFPEYDRLNTTYAETIQAMDDFGTAIGRTIDPDSPSAASAIGTSLRGLGSNRQTRGRLLDSVQELDSLGNRYANFDDDVITQTAFTIDLDRVFGTKADTSLSGVLGEAAATAPTSTGQFIGAAARAAGNKLRGVNQERQFEAMRNLLKSFNDQN